MKRTLISAFVVIILMLLFSCSEEQKEYLPQLINLSQNWQFQYHDSLYPTQVPGNIYTDLMKHKIIPDPFIASNEDSVQWVSRKNWKYTCNFQLDTNVLEKSDIEMVFNGLDTRAEVTLNGSRILSADNMFRTWKVDVKDVLKTNNVLKIKFFSVPEYNDSIAEMASVPLPENRVYTRKAPYQSGWDWGPALPGCGIWRNVELLAWNDLKINDFQVYYDLFGDSLVKIDARIELMSDKNQIVSLDMDIQGENGKSIVKTVTLGEGINIVHLKTELENPKLWWPVKMGEAYLYDFLLTATSDRKIKDTANVKTGFRTIQVVNEKDSIGESFGFKINGKPLFMKGANYIPQDIFPSRVSREKYEQLIADALEANMNMLRVWGGGIYEDDVFYKLCDEKGILVWQDFMFACAFYPGDNAFLDNVKQEATDNIQRLRNHPCIALWCGNNEVDEAWNNWGWQQQLGYDLNDSNKVWGDYEALFHNLLPSVIQQYDPQRFYWPSSPKFGWGREQSLTHGDMHYWGVWWGAEPFEIYKEKVGRFMSEYGFQGFPAYATIDSFASKKDQILCSAALKTHQKHPRGFELIDLYMKRDFPVPESFRDYVYVSQLVQAEGMKIAIEAHRRAMPDCMGTLYWQLNDCWPAVSWSSVDYYGNWKALHYFVQNAYKEIILSFQKGDRLIDVFIVSDMDEPVSAELQTKIIGFNGELFYSDTYNIEVKPLSSSVYQTLEIDSLLIQDSSRVLVNVKLIDRNGTQLAESNYFFTDYQNLALPRENYIVEIEKNDQQLILKFSSDILIKNLFIWTEFQSKYSHNFFDLLPNEEKLIYIQSTDIPEDFEGKIHYVCLNEILGI